jgi:hypothetical protein
MDPGASHGEPSRAHAVPAGRGRGSPDSASRRHPGAAGTVAVSAATAVERAQRWGPVASRRAAALARAA